MEMELPRVRSPKTEVVAWMNILSPVQDTEDPRRANALTEMLLPKAAN
jgi:hypothetical protein